MTKSNVATALFQGCVKWTDGREERFPGPTHAREYRDWAGVDGHIYQTVFVSDEEPVEGVLFYRQRGTRRVEVRNMPKRDAEKFE